MIVMKGLDNQNFNKEKMQYEIYTDEILKVHSSYYIEAESEEEAREKFEELLETGNFSDTPLGDIYESELLGYEILKIH